MCKIDIAIKEGVSSIDLIEKHKERSDTPMKEKALTNLTVSDLWKEFKCNFYESDTIL